MGVELSEAGRRLVEWTKTWKEKNLELYNDSERTTEAINKFTYDFEQQALKEYTFATQGNVIAYSGKVGDNPLWQVTAGICENSLQSSLNEFLDNACRRLKHSGKPLRTETIESRVIQLLLRSSLPKPKCMCYPEIRFFSAERFENRKISTYKSN